MQAARDKLQKSTALRRELRDTKQLEATEGEHQKGDEFSAAEESALEEQTKTNQLSSSPESEERRKTVSMSTLS